MNFFTKPITYQDMVPITCTSWTPGTYNKLGTTSTILSLLKLEYENKDVVLLDPQLIVETMFFMQGWEEGWDLIKDKLQIFINEFGPAKDMNLSLQTREDRMEAYKVMVKDKLFIKTGLRLSIIKLIEEL